MRLIALVGGVFAACGSPPSKLDSLAETTDSAGDDPWSATTPASKPTRGDDQSAQSGGFDLKGVLAKIGETLDKPGPYEPPEKSADYDRSAAVVAAPSCGRS